MTNIRYEAGDDARGPSATLWDELEPWRGIHPSDGWGAFDDFLDDRTTAVHNCLLLEEDNSPWAPITGEENGVFRTTMATDTNEEAGISWGNTNVCAPLVIDEGYGRVWFEGRIRVSKITTGVAGWVFGLAEEGFNAADAIVDGAASPTTDGTGIVGKDFVGFGQWVDAGTEIDAFYHTAGATAVIHKAAVGTLAAATWIKLGLYFDGQNQVWFFVDGVRYGTAALTSTSGFPDGEEMTPTFCCKMVTNAGITMDIDWWAFAQEAVVGKNC